MKTSKKEHLVNAYTYKYRKLFSKHHPFTKTILMNYLTVIIVGIAIPTCPSILKLTAETERIPPGVGIKERLGTRIPTKLTFINESGKEVTLGSFLSRRLPLVIVPSYYTCTRLCSFIFQGLQKAADQAATSGMRLGRDYRIISLSINPDDNAQSAHEKGKEIRSQFQNLRISAKHWQFLSDNQQNVRSLMKAIGYSYHWDQSQPSSSDDKQKDISHSAAIVFISPNGKIMRYLYGIQFPDRDFRLALVESANGRIGSTVEKILLYCFRYDSIEGKYTPAAWAFMRIGALLTIVFLLTLWFILLFLKKARRIT